MGCSFHLLASYGSVELSYNKQDSTGEFILLLSCLEIFCDNVKILLIMQCVFCMDAP
jgi:hypothetical protein